jgi:hypothetical protein
VRRHSWTLLGKEEKGSNRTYKTQTTGCLEAWAVEDMVGSLLTCMKLEWSC